jgi:hypothetical protein
MGPEGAAPSSMPSCPAKPEGGTDSRFGCAPIVSGVKHTSRLGASEVQDAESTLPLPHNATARSVLHNRICRSTPRP